MSLDSRSYDSCTWGGVECCFMACSQMIKMGMGSPIEQTLYQHGLHIKA